MLREFLSYALCFVLVKGHGFMWDPPGRGTAWLRGYTQAPINYNHMENFCGGFGTQWNQNGGKCGVCGDDYSGTRHHEVGGTYAPVNRPITGTYVSGSVIEVGVNLTQYHNGSFTFRLCVNNDLSTEVTQACLNQTELLVSGTNSSIYNNLTDSNVPVYYVINLQLPAGVVATQAVLQMKYTTGNRWGSWTPEIPNSGYLGGGPQEEFVNCADIAIVSSNTSTSSTASTSTSSSQTTTTTTTTTTSSSTSPTTASSAATSPTSTPTTTFSAPTTSPTTTTTSQTTSPTTTTTAQTTSPTTTTTAQTTSPTTTTTAQTTSPTTTTTAQTTSPTTTTSAQTTSPTTTTTAQTTSPTTTTSAPITAPTTTTTAPTNSPTTTTSGTTSSPTTSTTSPTSTPTTASSSTSASTTTQATTTTTASSCSNSCEGQPTSAICSCEAVGAHANTPGMGAWCYNNCRALVPNCPSSFCICYCN